MKKANSHIIIDCFTDEPSGFGAPPFIGIHSRYLMGSLISKGYDVNYTTIDDLRYNSSKTKTQIEIKQPEMLQKIKIICKNYSRMLIECTLLWDVL